MPGPGLWPVPCRQARWAGSSGVNGAPQARPRVAHFAAHAVGWGLVEF